MVYQKNLKYQTKGELEQINDDEGLSSTSIFKRDTNNHVLSIMNKLHKKREKAGVEVVKGSLDLTGKYPNTHKGRISKANILKKTRNHTI